MKDNSIISALAQPASSLVLPIQLAQQAAGAVRELLAEAAAANTTRSYGIELTLPVAEATMLQFMVDHVVRRSAEGELAWELPPAVDQTLAVAGLKAKLGPWTLATVPIGSRCCRPRTGSSTWPIRANSRRPAPCSAAPPGRP